MKQVRELDFTLMPTIESMDILIRLEKDVKDRLNGDAPLKEIYERSEATLMFLYGASEEKESWRNSAYIRACLNEFYSIEDAARRDFKKRGRSAKPPRIRDSLNPLVHLMYLLRHVNVHAKISRTKVHPTSVISRMGGTEHQHEYGAIILETPTLTELLECKEAKQYYCIDDLETAAEWLDEAQHIFGVSEILRRGLSAYCRELLESAEATA